MMSYKITSQIKSSIIIAMFALGFIACQDHKNDDSKKVDNHILGLASPIRLKFDSTTVYLTDYFPEKAGFEKIEWNGKTWTADSAGILLLTGKAGTPVSNLQITFKGATHDIPVFASEKVKHSFTYKASKPDVQIVEMSGSLNGWNRKATPLMKNGDQWSTELILNNGLYQYRIWEDGVEMMDANNPDKIDNGMGAFNNTFYAGEKKGDKPRMLSMSENNGNLQLKDLGNATNILAYCENKLIPSKKEGNIISIAIPEETKKQSNASIRVFADNGVDRYNDILIPLASGKAITEAKQLTRKHMNASVMYFAMVDRFVNGDSTNDRPTQDPSIHPKANNLGGDLAGITQKIKDGYFAKMGINTIWISPVSKNAEGAWGLWNKGVNSTFSAYHGYWPVSMRSIDDRFGNEAQMKELIDVAHKNNMNVILDYVAHHVHQDHPLYKQKPEWTTPLYLPDGTMNTEKWDEHRLTTWFDTFLPTWKFENHEVVEALTDTAMYWVENYELDGFRHDATKHINEDFWRTLTKKVKNYRTAHPERQIYQVGETYGNPELISSYINSGEMDAQFDFNLYDAAVDAFAKDNTDFKNLERVMTESMSYYGSHHLMGNITGNQDRARFISYADGSVQFSEDAKLAGWTREINNNGETGFNKLAMLNTFLMTTPGIPCIYYGDEIGMPGGNDPDNRRMMYFENWNEQQQKLFDATAKLINLRKENMALTYGDLFVIKNEGGVLAYVRSYMGKNVIVVFSKGLASAQSQDIEIPEEFRIPEVKSLNQNGINYINGAIQFDDKTKFEGWTMQVFY